MKERKSFWQRPEGQVGKWLGIGMFAAGGWAFLKLLPFMILAATNTLHLMGLLAAVGGVAYVVSDRRARTLGSYAYQSAMRRLTGLFITIDPIGILKNYVQNLNERVESMREKRQELGAKMRQLKAMIEKNAAEADEATGKASHAKEAGKKQQFALQARRAGQLAGSNKRLSEVFRTQERLMKGLDAYIEVATNMVAAIETDVDVQTRERAMIQGSYGVMREVRNILSGKDNPERELFEQTMEALAEDYGQKVGEIEEFLDMSTGFIEGLQLEQGTFEADAMKRIEEWEQRGSSLLLEDKSQVVNPLPAARVKEGVAAERTVSEGYRKLFERDE